MGESTSIGSRMAKEQNVPSDVSDLDGHVFRAHVVGRSVLVHCTQNNTCYRQHSHSIKKVNVAHTRLPSVGFWSRSRFLAVSLQVMRVINPAVGCHYFPPGLQLPPQPLRRLLPILLLGEQRHNGCEQFA